VYFTEREREIIRTFYVNLDLYDRETMTLKWSNGSVIIAKFDTCFDDDNELEPGEDGYEDFNSFVFEVINVFGNPPVYISKDKLCLINYKNFPDEILVGNKKIN